METPLNLPTLISQGKTGDLRALQTLYHTYAPPIRRYCYQRLNNHGRAEQCVQATFVEAWQNLTTFEYRSDSLFAAWLYTIANKVLTQQLRRDAAIGWGQPHRTQDHGQHLNGSNAADQHAVLAQAINLLSIEQQQVISLKFFAGLSNRDIATAINQSERVVKSIQHRAIHQLHQLIM